MKKLFLISNMLFYVLAVHGQNPFKFGKVPLDDLQMAYYPKDSNASAVVLHDYGTFDGAEFIFTRHVRIKILKKEGLSWANWTLYTPSKSNFRGATINLSDEGESVVEKLNKSAIYEEEYFEGRKRYKLFFTGVKAGSVIDLKYTFYGMPYQWRFQNLIPVRHSELVISESRYINFNRRSYGFLPIPEVETNHWIVRDVPAFVSEPYAAHYSNFIAKFEFEISNISFPGYYKDYASTWQEVSESLLEYEYFGGILRTSGFLNEEARVLRESGLTLEEKIQEAYYYIKENIKWNGDHSVFASMDYVSNFRKKHSGNAADINLALLALLTKADIKAWPVVMSLRGNGIIAPFFPSIDKLNYVAICLKIGDRITFLDATLDHMSPGLLPAKCLNGQGWLVDKHHGEWVDLEQEEELNYTNFSNIHMTDSEEWIAQLSVINKSYAYLDWKEDTDDFKLSDQYVKRLEEINEGWYIEDYEKVKDDTLRRESREKFIINISDHITESGLEKIIQPIVMNPFDSNPFKAQTRKYPIDLVQKRRMTYTVSIKIPEGYTIKHIPATEKIVIGEGDIHFSYLIQESFGSIQIQMKYRQQKTLFVETEYADVQAFYSNVVQSIKRPIVITKNT